MKNMLIMKHRKNCECCPVSQLIVRSQRLSRIQVLNCQNCNKCLKCHKSLGLLLGGVLKMSLSLSLSFFCTILFSNYNGTDLQRISAPLGHTETSFKLDNTISLPIMSCVCSIADQWRHLRLSKQAY